MNKITSVEPRKFNAKVLCCALGLMGVVSGGDAQCYDARADSMVSPPQTQAIVMVAQTNQAVRSPANAKRVMGVCYVVANIPAALEKYDAGVFPSQSLVYPYEYVSAYFSQFEHRNINIYTGNVGPLDTSSSVIVKPPKHGILVDTGVGKYQAYLYKPEAGYFGKDSAVIEAEVNGLKVKIQYYFHSLDTKKFIESKVCGKNWPFWKISQDANGTPTLTAVSYQSPFTSVTGTTVADTAALTAALDSNILSNLAGNGWFVDTTPSLIPTTNPNKWVAKGAIVVSHELVERSNHE